MKRQNPEVSVELPARASTEVRQKNELLFQAPLPTRLNDDEKRANALQAIKDYRWQQSHSIEGGCLTMSVWKHILQALYIAQKKGIYEEKYDLDRAILEVLQYFDYDIEAWRLGFFRLHEPNTNTFLVIDTVTRDDTE